MKENYNNLFKNEVAKFDKKYSILLHSCCAPCSSHVISVLKKLSDYIFLTVFYFLAFIKLNISYTKNPQLAKKNRTLITVNNLLFTNPAFFAFG